MTIAKQGLQQLVAAQRVTAPQPVAKPKPTLGPTSEVPGHDQDAVIASLMGRIFALEQAVSRLEQMLSKEAAPNTVTLYGGGRVNIHANTEVQIDGSKVTISAAAVHINAAYVGFAGVLKCDTLIANHVQSASYSPGAGNIW
jgi:hypothetical protein